MSRLLAVILNWRAAETALEGIEGALTIVDNDSGDGSFERRAAEVAARGWDAGPQRVRVLQSGHNGGFGAGNNFAIRAGLPGGGRPDHVYLLNSAAFPAPDAIRALLDHLESHPGTGFAGSLTHGVDGTPHRTAFRFPSILSEFEGQLRLGPVSRLLHRRIVAQPVPERSGRVDWLAGASLTVRQEMLDRIGLFDERFFLYFEETDLCRRAAVPGWPADFVRESRVAHVGSASTGMRGWARIPQYWLDSRLHYFTVNHGRADAALATLAGGTLWRLRLLVQRRVRGDPRRFLRDLAAHQLCNLLPRRATGQPARHPAPKGQGPVT